MQGFVDYIFNHMNDAEMAIKCTRKRMGRLDFLIGGLIVSTTIKAISDSMRDREIAKLKKEIAELKQKGD